MLLWGRMLTGMQQRLDGRVVFAVLEPAMLEETGTQQHDADGLAELIAHTKGAQISLLLRELGTVARPRVGPDDRTGRRHRHRRA
ncbi:MAG TPA: hypothetical protein VGP30_04985, partial [Candidatus Limnocylindrales bacterium]|nr:hypothetical protein [Candidatus Limnocylindrales bacterium]